MRKCVCVCVCHMLTVSPAVDPRCIASTSARNFQCLPYIVRHAQPAAHIEHTLTYVINAFLSIYTQTHITGVVELAFRLPGGKRAARRFSTSSPVSALYV